jgi:nitrous oxide reductase accessory protein NosL
MNIQLVALIALLLLTAGGGLSAAEQRPGHAAGRMRAGAAEPIPPDVKMNRACPHCGMDREKFAGSRMHITYADGSSVGVCSIHCMVTELKAGRGRSVKSVAAADLSSKKLVDAEKATWVIGGSKKGVMTGTPKWAFTTAEDAAAFIQKNGGRLATYGEALSLAEKD